MSDGRPRRAVREAAREEAAAGEDVPPEAAALIAVGSSAEPAANTPTVGIAAATPLAGPAAVAEESPQPPQDAVRDAAWAAFAETQAALARGFEQIAVEMAAIARSDLAAATGAATALLDARSFAEAVEIAAGLMRRNIDSLIEGSARVSQIGVRVAADASQPILARLATGWNGAGIGSL